MTPIQDLTLPKTAPNNDRHRSTAGAKYTQAVYSLVALDQAALTNLVDKLNSAADIEPGTCALAPSPTFANRPLRDIYTSHLSLRDQDPSIHPLFFIVATDADYEANGVLVVHLDTGQAGEQDRVDKARCSVDWAASWGLNLDIGNLAWEDLKEEEAEEWGGDMAMPWTPEGSQLKRPDGEPPRWKYACFSLVRDASALPESLEPDYYVTPIEHKRVIIGGNYSTAGGLPEVIRLFPWFCKSHPETHRQLAILADKPDFEDDGVMLLHFDWDGNADAHDYDSIVRLDLKYETIKRVPASRAVADLDEYGREHGLPLAISG